MVGCNRSTRSFFQEGVSIELARYRAKQIYDVSYKLHFDIPESKNEPVKGNTVITFKPLKARHGVILDFTPGERHVHSIRVNNDSTFYSVMNGHIYIDANELIPRQNNTIDISFTSSDQALNRSDDFLYTLFVPDRASTAFPCFDQPDIKAEFHLSLDIPESWNAISNGKQDQHLTQGNRKTVHFAGDNPISTYLFAFAAGRFDTISQSKNGRTITLFHRETDTQKLENNTPSLFQQHFDALQWLEEYTGIAYPYSKFDIAVLPGFQYSGMEHPGAIWYRDTRVFLPENAPITSVISKANLIAHETAHMWFGNLVTMKWFDDVWLKEVFAGFMADKIVAEQFPDHNHNLQFILSHYPKTMTVDRSLGTHPIKQELSNMKMAGTLYGAIIYNKAPIVFQQLEQIMEPENFRQAVREYLRTFSHDNADWSDLVTIFDKYSDSDITGWSNAWVYGKGMPNIAHKTAPDNPGNLVLEQTNMVASDDFPMQMLGLLIKTQESEEQQNIWFNQPVVPVNDLGLKHDSRIVIPNGTGMGYGYFILSPTDIDFLKQKTSGSNSLNPLFPDETMRAQLYINVFENFLNGNMDEDSFAQFLFSAVESEEHQPLINYLLGILETWALRFPYYSQNEDWQKKLDDLLWEKLTAAPARSAETYFESWMTLTRQPGSDEKMDGLYNGAIPVPNLTISDENRTQLALEYTIRYPANRSLVEKELNRIDNPDRLRRLEFILPAISSDPKERDEFFNQLKKAENRRPEPWVLDALYFLHHPAHTHQGKQYVAESLVLLEEIQKTGDIFFPLNWLAATFQQYHDPEIITLVEQYLEENPQLPENLKLKVFQATDINFRSGEHSRE